MITVTIYKTHAGEIVGFESKGHAGFARFGKDIVCASVSALVINTINAIEQFTDVEFEGKADNKAAVISMKVSQNSSESLVLLQALELGLTTIMKDNPKYISITFEEV